MMNKEELQKLWDRRLLEGWYNEWSMGRVQGNVYREAKGLSPDTYLDWGKVDEFFQNSGLKRHQKTFGPLPTRAFVEAMSPNLSGCLWSGKHSEDDILRAIDNFKWNAPSVAVLNKHHNRKSGRKNYNKKKKQGERVVEARSLDKGHDWNTIK